jgi:hypothetical protein
LEDADVKLERIVWMSGLWLGACATRAEPPASTTTPTTTSEPVATVAPVVEDAGVEQEEPKSEECPAPEHGAHCLWMATNPPNPKRADHVAKKMKADGFPAEADGDRIVVHLDDAQLKRLFGGEISHEKQAASSSDHMRCVATIPDGRKLDARYRGEVGEVMLDDPACEL